MSRWLSAFGVVTWTGLVWAGLYHWLFIGGHAPTKMTGLLLASPDYYGLMRGLIVPILLGCWLLFSAAAVRLTQAFGGAPQAVPLTQSLAASYALPLLFFFVVPDLAIFGIAGFSAIAWLLPYYAWLAPLLQIGFSTHAIRRHSTLKGRAVLVACLAFVLQTVPFAVLVR